MGSLLYPKNWFENESRTQDRTARIVRCRHIEYHLLDLGLVSEPSFVGICFLFTVAFTGSPTAFPHYTCPLSPSFLLVDDHYKTPISFPSLKCRKCISLYHHCHISMSNINSKRNKRECYLPCEVWTYSLSISTCRQYSFSVSTSLRQWIIFYTLHTISQWVWDAEDDRYVVATSMRSAHTDYALNSFAAFIFYLFFKNYFSSYQVL